LPPIADGFARFLAAPEIAAQVTEGIETEINEAKVDPYDTHPALRDRVAAIQRLTVAPSDENTALALSLLDNPESAELQFLAFVNPNAEQGSLRRVAWDDIGPQVIIPAWKSMTNEYASLLQGITAAAVPDFIPKLPEIGSRMRDPKGMLLAPQQRMRRAGHLIASALALALLDKGWQLETRPGVFYFHRGAERANTFTMMGELVAGKVKAEAWITSCAELGISESVLAPASNLISAAS
jgi:heat shock protein HtpX